MSLLEASRAPVPAADAVKPPSMLRRLVPTARLPEGDDLGRLTRSEIAILAERLRETLDVVYHADFSKSDAESKLFGGAGSADAGGDRSRARRNANDDSGMYLLVISGDRPRSSVDERQAFLRFNYCRYRVMKVLKQFRGKPLTLEAAREAALWEARTRAHRGAIVQSNLPLVAAMSKRTRQLEMDSADLMSEGNLALLRSVDKFDCSRGFKFSTYACRAILKGFSRVAARSARYRVYFPKEYDPTLERSSYLEQCRQGTENECMSELKAILGTNMANLNEIEQAVLNARFALDEVEKLPPGETPRLKTLEQVGDLIGVTKERVRQIQNKALAKLRHALEENVFVPR